MPRGFFKLVTSAHTVISNFNTDPANVVACASSYEILDQSDDLDIRRNLIETYEHVSVEAHVGHNLCDYMNFILRNWEELPPLIAFVKGNIMARHCDPEFFYRAMRNEFYTPLFCRKSLKTTPMVSALAGESFYLERNTSWYMETRESRYFQNLNEFLSFVYIDPVWPDWVQFAPGGCYIVSRSQITRYPREFFRCLSFLGSYAFFPAEAYLLERAMHTIGTGSYRLQPYMADFEEFLIRARAFGARMSSTRLNGLTRGARRRSARVAYRLGAYVDHH